MAIDGGSAALALGLVSGFVGLGVGVRCYWSATEAWGLAQAASRQVDELLAHDDERSALWQADRRELAARDSELKAEKQVVAYLYEETQDLRHQLRDALGIPHEGADGQALTPATGIEVANRLGELLGGDTIERGELTFAKVQKVMRDTAVGPLLMTDDQVRGLIGEGDARE